MATVADHRAAIDFINANSSHHSDCIVTGDREAAERAYAGVRPHVDGLGLVRGVCGCPDFLREGTSAEAQAAFVMADAWRRKAGHEKL